MPSPTKPFILTDEERDLVTKNHNLIYTYLNQHCLSDDYYDLCAIGLCRAVHFYKSEKGKFSTFAFLCMSNVINMDWRKLQRQVKPVVSLNDTIKNSETQIEIQDTVADPSDDYVLANVSAHIHYVYKNNPLTKSIADLYVKGYSAAEIARMLNAKYPTVRRRIAIIKQELQNF